MIGLERAHERLDVLSKMEEGWYQGQGWRPSETALRRARAIIDAIDTLDPLDVILEAVSLFPTYEGGVQFEWVLEKRATDVEVASDGNVNISSTDVDTGHTCEANMQPTIDSVDVARKIIEFL